MEYGIPGYGRSCVKGRRDAHCFYVGSYLRIMHIQGCDECLWGGYFLVGTSRPSRGRISTDVMYHPMDILNYSEKP